MEFGSLLDRFIRYVKIDTQSSDISTTFPSTKKQRNLAEVLKQELIDLGLTDTKITRWGYVLATLPSNTDSKKSSIALIAHLDTSPDLTGENVNPKIHKGYAGGDIVLSDSGEHVLKVADNPYLEKVIGKTVITTDGTTLLGTDNKAGIAEIMAAVEYLVKHPEIPRPRVRIVFTPDEEVGRGADHVSIKQINADYGYTVDGGLPGYIDVETFCADTMDITINGINYHPGTSKDKMVNAIKIAAEFVEQLPKGKNAPEFTSGKEGYIHPNSMIGSVEQVQIRMLIRDFQEEGLTSRESLVREILDRVAKNHPKATIQVNVTQTYRNMYKVLEKHPVVIEKVEAAVLKSGLEYKSSWIRGGTDGCRLSFMGLPCPNIFTGGVNTHSRFEWIALEDMEKCAEVLVNLVNLWA